MFKKIPFFFVMMKKAIGFLRKAAHFPRVAGATLAVRKRG